MLFFSTFSKQFACLCVCLYVTLIEATAHIESIDLSVFLLHQNEIILLLTYYCKLICSLKYKCRIFLFCFLKKREKQNIFISAAAVNGKHEYILFPFDSNTQTDIGKTNQFTYCFWPPVPNHFYRWFMRIEELRLKQKHSAFQTNYYFGRRWNTL